MFTNAIINQKLYFTKVCPENKFEDDSKVVLEEVNLWDILYYKIQFVCVIVCTCGIGSQTMHTTVMNLLQGTQWV